MDLSLSKETSDDSEVIAQGIESPCCAHILYDCLKNLELEGNEIYEVSSSIKNAQIKDAKMSVEDVSESIKFINKNLRNMKLTGNKR